MYEISFLNVVLLRDKKQPNTHTHTNCSIFEYRIKETEYEPNLTKNNKTFFLKRTICFSL